MERISAFHPGHIIMIENPNKKQIRTHLRKEVRSDLRLMVHHVGANPNTFVYPGGIAIIRLLTRK